MCLLLCYEWNILVEIFKFIFFCIYDIGLFSLIILTNIHKRFYLSDKPVYVSY